MNRIILQSDKVYLTKYIANLIGKKNISGGGDKYAVFIK